MDDSICRLTLVTDESFADFRDGFNAEFADTAGADGKPEVDDADDEVEIKRREPQFTSREFKEFWKRIRFKSRYRVSVDADALAKQLKTSNQLVGMAGITRLSNTITEADVVFDDEGRIITNDNQAAQTVGEAEAAPARLTTNVVSLVDRRLESTHPKVNLTRRTVANVVDALPAAVKRVAVHDPERWAQIVADAIRHELLTMLPEHITYTPTEKGDWWDAKLVFHPSEIRSRKPSGDTKGEEGVLDTSADGPNLYTAVYHDSRVERDFAAKLDAASEVKLFTKLPRRFQIRTPVGMYAPDWAIVVERNGETRVYLVRETKSELDIDEIAWAEAMRIRFAAKHFEVSPAGDVDFKHTNDTDPSWAATTPATP